MTRPPSSTASSASSKQGDRSRRIGPCSAPPLRLRSSAESLPPLRRRGAELLPVRSSMPLSQFGCSGPRLNPNRCLLVAALQGGQPPRCQVEGCRVDLSDAKAYYSRHKVCGMHSKSPKVIVSGLEQRFCQQCSRFHQLPEFDQGKRSCRRRLAGHNERRRKSPASSLMSSRYGSLSPSIFDARSRSGGFVMDFSTHPTFPGNQASITGKYHPPLQSSSQHPLSHHLLQGTTSSGGCYNDSTNALSLLSTQPWGPRTRSTSLGATHYLGTDMAHPSINHGMTIAPFAYNHAMHEMPPDLGHGQNSHGTMNEFTGELGLGQPNEGQLHELVHSRGYDASLQHMNWSL